MKHRRAAQGRASATISATALAACWSIAACQHNDRLLIEITHPGSRDPALWQGRLQAAIVDVEQGAVVADSELATGVLADRTRVFDDLSLEEGRRYQLLINALLEGRHPCQPLSRAVGVSPEFAYRRDLDQLAVYVDCAEQVSSVAILGETRLYHTATFVPGPPPHGRVVIAGGAVIESLAQLSDLSQAEGRDSIEVFEPGSGTFRLLDARLAQRRALHQAVAVGGDVLFTGGLNVAEVAGKRRIRPLDLVERLAGERLTAEGELAGPRALHAAVLVAPDRLLLAGGVVENLLPLRTAELYDVQQGRSLGELPRMNAARLLPAAVGVGDQALLIGGVWLPGVEIPEERFCLSGSCGGCAGPCFARLGGFGADGGRSALGAAHVPCADGAPGAVYAVGGHHDETETVPAVVHDDIYCVELGSLERGLQLVGHLLQPRYGHTVSLVRGPDQGQRLFVAGGAGQSGLIRNAELVPVSCRCDPVSQGSITTVSLNSERSGHTATVLADGTVLIVGGIVGSDTAERFNPVF